MAGRGEVGSKEKENQIEDFLAILAEEQVGRGKGAAGERCGVEGCGADREEPCCQAEEKSPLTKRAGGCCP